MLNKANLVGRLTKDVDLKYLGNGTPVGKFTLAVNRPFKNKQGENEADFINIVVWRKQAENCAQYIGKGSLVAISGRIQTRNFEGNDGKRVYITEIVSDEVHFLDTKKNDRTVDRQEPYMDGLKTLDDNESELPF